MILKVCYYTYVCLKFTGKIIKKNAHMDENINLYKFRARGLETTVSPSLIGLFFYTLSVRTIKIKQKFVANVLKCRLGC